MLEGERDKRATAKADAELFPTERIGMHFSPLARGLSARRMTINGVDWEAPARPDSPVDDECDVCHHCAVALNLTLRASSCTLASASRNCHWSAPRGALERSVAAVADGPRLTD